MPDSITKYLRRVFKRHANSELYKYIITRKAYEVMNINSLFRM